MPSTKSWKRYETAAAYDTATRRPTLRVKVSIHPSAWKNSQKLACRMAHSPARWPPYGRPEISRLLKVDHYKLHLRIMVCSGGCVAFSQNTDADRGRGVIRSLGPRVEYRRSGLPDIGVCTSDLKPVEYGQARRVLETTFFAYRGV
jgi:hypothetical protein